ncbi:hypothetical protein MUN82_09595 [Hymenobacter aerilatus]|uniref:Uncharacterized protein n=1 Tax=Hymenobacter aerilatus TaxID=2932251 RepID=A0A8T9T2C9_9BACT|nr:hypothetical protein [Hymenobacter aerilatus]UOR07334.1 hypothetical protein MUN82_09595 [Hymenobacter aerilatus]
MIQRWTWETRSNNSCFPTLAKGGVQVTKTNSTLTANDINVPSIRITATAQVPKVLVEGRFLLTSPDPALYVRRFEFYDLSGVKPFPTLPAGNP